MIDNIPRGTVIRDATIERFATSAEVRDRVLGESRTEAVPVAGPRAHRQRSADGWRQWQPHPHD